MIAAKTADLFQGRHLGAILGVISIGTGVGAAGGAWASGLIFDLSGSYRLAFILSIVSYLAGCVGFWFLRRPAVVRGENRTGVAEMRRLAENASVPRAAMVRTTTILVFVALLFLPGTAHAQPAPKLPVIGILATGQDRSRPPYPALERALREHGLVDGQNIRIVFRMAEGHIERLPGLARELVRANVDVIVAGGTLPSLEAAREASGVVPIVMIAVDYDPLATRAISSLQRPGKNITGVFIRQVELTAKRMQLLKEIVPQAKQVAIFSDPFTVDQLKMARTAAPTFGLRLKPVLFETPPYDYVAAFASVAKERSSAVLVTVGPLFFRDRAAIIEAAAQLRLPTMFPLPEFADAGGLIAYGANLDATFASAAPYVEKILKGARPGDLPVEQPKSFELVVNMKTARAMGITVPPSVLLRADRLIQEP